MTNETTQAQGSEETIEEVGTTAEAPVTQGVVSAPEGAEAEQSLAGADKAEAVPTDDSTFEERQGLEENFLGTFKTKEDAHKGFKDAQSKITEQANRIKQLESELKDNFTPASEIEKRVTAFNTELGTVYHRALSEIGNRHFLVYNKLKNETTDPQRLAELEQAYQANMFAEIAKLNAAFDLKRNQGKFAIEQEVHKAYAELRARDMARYSNGKTGEMILKAWYESPSSIDEVARLFSEYKSLVLEEYLKERSEQGEDTAHKGKLATNADSHGKPKYSNNHIFTLKELAAMSDAEFAKYESIIDEQVAKRLVK